jgi:putative mRNA 3-end processing factor
MSLIESRPEGLYCTQGDFFIDPLQPVGDAVITHAHADHFCSNCDSYYGHRHTIHFLKRRMGRIAPMFGFEYKETFEFNGVKVSLHSAGHMPGSAQVKISYKGEVWVITGDLDPSGNPYCEPFEQLKCDHLITECTFSDPKYVWPNEDRELQKVKSWYQDCTRRGEQAVLSAYAIGKAQKLQFLLSQKDIPVMVHPTVAKFNESYKELGFKIPDYKILKDGMTKSKRKDYLILTPPSVYKTAWMLRFDLYSAGLCSGWVLDENVVDSRGANIGFVLSDHADFEGLVGNIKQSEATSVYLMHGDKQHMSLKLKQLGLETKILRYQ